MDKIKQMTIKQQQYIYVDFKNIMNESYLK